MQQNNDYFSSRIQRLRHRVEDADDVIRMLKNEIAVINSNIEQLEIDNYKRSSGYEEGMQVRINDLMVGIIATFKRTPFGVFPVISFTLPDGKMAMTLTKKDKIETLKNFKLNDK